MREALTKEEIDALCELAKPFMRDLFAAAAIASGFCTKAGWDMEKETNRMLAAQVAYGVADAMIVTRDAFKDR